MKTYTITETYMVTRVVRVLAPDPEAAKAWDVHPKVFVLDGGTPKNSDHNSTVEEEQ